MKTKTISEIVSEHPMIEGLSAEDVALIAGCARNTHFKAEQYLFKEGEPANAFYLIRHGSAAIESYAPGKGPLRIMTYGEGDIVGISWLVPPFFWRFDVRAVTALRVIEFDAVCLRDKCDAEPRLGYILLQRLASQLIDRVHASRVQQLDLYGKNGA